MMIGKPGKRIPYWVKIAGLIAATAAQMGLVRELIGRTPRADIFALASWGLLCIFVAWTQRQSCRIWIPIVSIVTLCIWWFSIGDFAPTITATSSPAVRLVLALVPLGFAFSLGVRLGSNGIAVGTLSLGLAAMGFIQVEMITTESAVIGGWREYANFTGLQVIILAAIGISAGLLSSFIGSRVRSILLKKA